MRDHSGPAQAASEEAEGGTVNHDRQNHHAGGTEGASACFLNGVLNTFTSCFVMRRHRGRWLPMFIAISRGDDVPRCLFPTPLLGFVDLLLEFLPFRGRKQSHVIFSL